MGDCLAGRVTDVDAEIVAIRHVVSLDASLHQRYESPDRRLLFRRQREETGLVSTGHDQAVTRTDRIRVEERDGEIVCRDRIFVGKAITKDASQVSTLTCPDRVRGEPRT